MADYCDLLFNWECDKDPTYVIDYFLECEDENDRSDSPAYPSKLQIYKGTEDDCTNTCQLTVQCKSLYHVGIKGVRFISESRNVEVYGQMEGYIQTVKGKSVLRAEEQEDVSLFMSDFSTPEPALNLTFKFLSLKGKLSFEMKRIQITLTQMEPPDDSSQMDIGKLRSHVKELGDKVSDKAKSLLDTMEQYQKNQHGTLDSMRSMISQSTLQTDKASSLSGMAGLLSMFSQMRGPRNSVTQTTPLTNDGGQDEPSDLAGNLLSQMSTSHNGEAMHSEDMYKFLHSVCGKVSKLRHTKAEDPVAEEIKDTSEKAVTPTDLHVMDEVNKQIQAAEERIANNLEKRLSEMEVRLNKKMDKILQLLSPEEEEKDWREATEEGPETVDRIPQAIDLD